MKLSIVIVNWNVCDLLRQCLCSLYEEIQMSSREFEVFVVDNASQDESVNMVRTEFPQVNLVANAENVGFGRANDQVLSECAGEYVLLLNPDTIIENHAIDVLYNHAVSMPDVAVMGCRLLNLDGSLQRWTGGAYPTFFNVFRHYFFIDKLVPARFLGPSLYLDKDEQTDIDVDWISGAVMLLKKDALKGRIFNEDFFMYGEDMECCYRLKTDGWRIVYSPICSITHIQGASMKKQEGEILLSSLKGLRSFFAMLHGKRHAWVVDTITISGFTLRWLAYSAMKWLTGKPKYHDKAMSSRKYMSISYKIMQQS